MKISSPKDEKVELKDTNLNVLEKCGHVCNIQKWKEFNHVALNYIDSIYSKEDKKK